MEKNQYDLKQLLQESGLSQSELAQKLGISRQHLHDIVKLNRKSKYSKQIFALLKQGHHEGTSTLKNELSSHETHQIEILPMIFPDDLIRMYSGEASLSLLSKPFYAQYPFLNFSNHENQFCLRLNDLFEDSHYISIGAFRLCISLELKKDQIVLLYLPDSEKLIMGKVEINLDTKEMFILNNKSVYSLRFHDILMAECTQVVHFLP